MVSAERFVGPEGSVRWGALAMVLVGSAWLALINGVIVWVLAFFGIVTDSIDGLVRFAISIVDGLFGGAGEALLVGWLQVRAIVTESEAFGFVFATLFVLALLFGIRWVITRG